MIRGQIETVLKANNFVKLIIEKKVENNQSLFTKLDVQRKKIGTGPKFGHK